MSNGPESTTVLASAHPRTQGRGDCSLHVWALLAAENALIGEPRAAGLVADERTHWHLSVFTRRLAPVPTALAGATILMLGVVLDAAGE